MSFSYSGDPSNIVLDEARFLIGDTDENEPIMQDEEIKYIIDTYGTASDASAQKSINNIVSYQLFNRAATLFARDIKRSLGPQSEDPTGRLNFFKEQANYYKNLVSIGGVSDFSAKCAYPKIFRKGMFSNPPYPKPRGKDYVQ